MSVETKLTFDKEYVQSFSDARNEPQWFKDIRLKGLELVETLELPKPDKTKITSWNFTNFDHKLPEVSPVASIDELRDEVKGLIGEASDTQNLLVQRDATVVYSKLDEALKAKGVIFTDLLTAVKEHGDLVEKYYMKDAVKVDENRLTALHAALVNGGTFIYVPRNVEIEVPLQSVFWFDTEKAGLFNHVIIVAEDNSSITYVENYASFGSEEAVANIVVEVFAGANAKVSFGAVDNLAAGVTTYVVRRAHVGRDSRVEWALGQMNDGNTVSENTTHLLGDNSWADTKTVSVGRGEQKQNFTTQIFHHGKHSEGYILKHGVMREAATSIFNGISKIEHGATKSHGEQTERVLMLSEKARGDANPILLIDEDDVTAGHAASVGKIDPIQMFYLMSRGISRAEAERLVIHGFLAPVVGQLPIESVKERLVEAIERKVK
ncbi:Fe-S cluster assembly protein SufD [Halalkalibacterium halodurans]|uniref:Fe-S cluster assembly protein SufD n=2 Tax=Halalkalibacterium halodurans TaxID=86665 RepID=A0A0M0KGW3_ALKHA|nr:Fe-S cluster assembly protein SufD [Halalkalibacterium halodurans]MDY7223998.1 Fe-S cluster assembly protein SufD [Halalkalibacterium halodurans]MDY7243283.1 Fe-S cluster assembly protein SufD [Halalkalibacterium halodurans]TPE66716.1 Fe-S cluster assembly protein SufD [Halalkalibacterium halodurans]